MKASFSVSDFAPAARVPACAHSLAQAFRPWTRRRTNGVPRRRTLPSTGISPMRDGGEGRPGLTRGRRQLGAYGGCADPPPCLGGYVKHVDLFGLWTGFPWWATFGWLRRMCWWCTRAGEFHVWRSLILGGLAGPPGAVCGITRDVCASCWLRAGSRRRAGVRCTRAIADVRLLVSGC